MALLSKKTAKRISEAINTIATANIMLDPNSIGMKNPNRGDYRERWVEVREDAKKSLRELGIEVV